MRDIATSNGPTTTLLADVYTCVANTVDRDFTTLHSGKAINARGGKLSTEIYSSVQGTKR
jgi:hypothetical protein